MRSRPLVTGLALVAVMAVGGLSACDSSGTPGAAGGAGSTSATTAPAAGLPGTTWLLQSYQAGAATVPAAPGGTASLTFAADGALAGSTGCNQFSGTYTTAESLTLTLGPMTQMACAGALVQAQEAAVVRLLPQVSGYHADTSTLTLTGSDGATLAVYRAGAAGLEGTSWAVTGVNNGTGGVESTTLTEHLTVTFGADGAFSAFGGCNTLSGTYATTGPDGVTITGLTSTSKACTPEVDALESQFTAALGQVATYAIAGDTATLRATGGATQVSLTQT